MKVTKAQLKQIIKEELKNIISETETQPLNAMLVQQVAADLAALSKTMEGASRNSLLLVVGADKLRADWTGELKAFINTLAALEPGQALPAAYTAETAEVPVQP